MCNQCNMYKNSYLDYNFCPVCGHRLKDFVFVPTSSHLNKNADLKKHVIYDGKKI